MISWSCLWKELKINKFDFSCWKINVTRSNKSGLIAGKYMFLLTNVYLYFCVSYNNSVSFSKISINFYISDENLRSCQLHTLSYKISNFEIMVKIWRAISPILSDQVTELLQIDALLMSVCSFPVSFTDLITCRRFVSSANIKGMEITFW